MSERYQNCPVCGSLCEIGGDKKEGTHYYVPVGDNAKLQAENAELWEFVKKVAKAYLYEWDDNLVEYLPSKACMEKDFADFNPSQTAYEKRIAELEAIDEKNTANLRRFQETLIEWKDKNNELSRKNSELEARLKESEDMADAFLLAVNEKQSEIFRQQSVIDLQRDKIAGLEAELDRNTSNLTRRAADFKVQLERAEEEVNNLKADRNVAAVAKPIVWYPWDGKGKPCVCFTPLGGYCLTIEEQGGEYYLYYHGTQLPPSPFSRHTPFKSVEAAKEAAQDWLNKLVAEVSMQSTCPENVSKNGDSVDIKPQFTAEEIDGIRKLAQFSGFMIANSIIAKCDAMRKGVQG